jgi:hypothetical protein
MGGAKMIIAPDKTDIVYRRLRAVLNSTAPDIATRAAWRVALLVAVKHYGAALTANALRDLADELERDLMGGPVQ